MFLDDWHECESELSEAQRAFMAHIETRTSEWLADIWLERTDEGCFPVLLVDLNSADENLVLLTAGIRVEDHRIHGDKLHSQLFSLPDEPTGLALIATGSPEELADRTTEWFDRLMRRQVVRHEWVHRGQVYASRYLFSDTGEGLCQMYNDALAPPWQRIRLLIAGRVKRRGWIDTEALGQPDRVVTVRGETDPEPVRLVPPW
ncbi:hypothetical protein [Nonomuraea sp. NPDC050691]|uniref:hypothetical protein n=1 Tax=Nonomuraea sp. NPDC050691 TaxID=3155661 RepID=UPI0033C1EEA8